MGQKRIGTWKGREEEQEGGSKQASNQACKRGGGKEQAREGGNKVESSGESAEARDLGRIMMRA